MNQTVESEKKIIDDFLSDELIKYKKKDFVDFNGVDTIKIYNGKKDVMSFEITQELIDDCKKIINLKKKYEKEFENKKQNALSSFISLVKYSKKDTYEYSTTTGTVYQHLKTSLMYFLRYDVTNRATLKKFIVGEINENSENQLLGIKIELIDVFTCTQNPKNMKTIKKYYIDKDESDVPNKIKKKETQGEKKSEQVKIDDNKEIKEFKGKMISSKEDFKKIVKETVIENTVENLHQCANENIATLPQKDDHKNESEDNLTEKQVKKEKSKSLKPIKFKEERLECLSKIKSLIKYDEKRDVIFEKNLSNDALKYFNENIHSKILLFFDSGDFKRIDTRRQSGFILMIKKIFKEFNYEMVKPSFPIKNEEGIDTKNFYYVTDISKIIS